MKRALSTAATFLLVLGAAAPSFAQPAGAQAEAQAAFKECERYANAAVYDRAIATCQRAYFLDGKAQYLWGLAQVYRFSGHHSEAAHAYQAYLALAGTTLLDYKQRAVEQLLEKEQALAAESAAPSSNPASLRASPSSAPAMAPTATIAPRPTPEEAPRSMSSERIVAWSFAGAAVVALAVGVGATVARQESASTWNTDMQSPPAGLGCQQNPNGTVGGGNACVNAYNAIGSAQNVAIAGYALGAAFGLTSAVLFVVSRSPEAPARVAFGCGAGPGQVGLSCAGAF